MRVIYVDDEQPALDNFRLTAAQIPQFEQLNLFSSGEAALMWVRKNLVDTAFLDMEMPGIHGIDLALKLREINPNIRVIFVTAYSQYALEAWGTGAIGYLLKPYTVDDIRKELEKCIFRPLPSEHIIIRTMPMLSVTVRGEPLHISGAKPRELFALLVDRGERGITSAEGIACLWPDKPNDASAQSLFRMTYKRLVAALEEAGAGHIVGSRENHRFLRVDQVECDLYRILADDENAIQKYSGQYLQEYSWAEERNAQLYWRYYSKILHNMV